jgi:hypothetical protein
MGHYCRICGERRPHECFRGKGRRTHICRACQQLPRAERAVILDQQEVMGYLAQSHISAKNCHRLARLVEHPDAEIRLLAQVVLEVAEVTPSRRRRYRRLAREHRDLFCRLRLACGEDWYEEEEWEPPTEDPDAEGEVWLATLPDPRTLPDPFADEGAPPPAHLGTAWGTGSPFPILHE